MNSLRSQLPKLLHWVFTGMEGLIVLVAAILAVLMLSTDALVTRDQGENGGAEISLGLAQMELELPRTAYELTSDTLKADDIRLDDVRGSVEVRNPTMVDAYLGTIRIPWTLLMLFVGAVGGAICDFFRRLFRNVRSGQSFHASTISYIYKIGMLIIVFQLGFSLLAGWVHGRAADFVHEHVRAEGITVLYAKMPSSGTGMGMGMGFQVKNYAFRVDVLGIVGGLMMLTLGEAFRQGLALREENELTV